ncbi:MAG: hypothetical protein ACRD4Y_10950, partial [Candidatus Acidiferrales bacterium]
MRRFLAFTLVAFALASVASSFINWSVRAGNDEGYAAFEEWVLKHGVSGSAAVDPGFGTAQSGFEQALQQRDKKAVAGLLNENFQWVNSAGEQHGKNQVLENLDALASNEETPLDVRT